MSEQPNHTTPLGFGQAIQVTADAVVTRAGQPVDDITPPTTVQED